MKNASGTASRLIRSLMWEPGLLHKALRRAPDEFLGRAYAESYQENGGESLVCDEEPANPLISFFNSHNTGAGIWKWRHYLAIYHRHLAKFVGHDIHFAEVGVFSGGSLSMWKSYFGSQATIHGIDLDEATRAYAADNLWIHIGDQADRRFWSTFRRDVPTLDAIVDDGGHQTQQQRVTLEEVLPHLRMGGVYICEDVHGKRNSFLAYVAGLIDELNAAQASLAMATRSFQSSIYSIHLYPFVVVIEKRLFRLERLEAERRGSEWQPAVVFREGYGRLDGRGG